MSVAASVYLTGGWILYALDPARWWVSLILFGMALLAQAVDAATGGNRA